MAKTPTYTTVYNCFPELVPKSHRDVVFYVLQKSLTQWRKNGKFSFRVSFREITRKHNLDRRTSKKSLDWMEEVGLATFSDSVCEMNMTRWIGAAQAYSELRDGQQEDFAQAFITGDVDKMKELGFNDNLNVDDELQQMKGALPTDKTPASEVILQHSSRTCGNYATQLPHVKELCNTTPALEGVMQQYYLTFIGQIRKNITENFSKKGFRGICDAQFPQLEDSDIIDSFIDAIFDPSIEYHPSFLLIGCGNCASWVRELCTSSAGVLHEGAGVMHEKRAKLPHSNNNINKKEEYNERSEALVDIGGMGEEDSDEEIAEKSKKRRQRKETNLPKEVQLRRKRENLQKFSEEEIDEIIEDLNNCLDSPAKIFINRLWNYMAVDFSQPENEEDDDEELSSVDITEEAIPASFIKRYMESAYEDTLSLLKEKRLSPDDEELPVVDAEFTPEDVQLIMGWEQYRSKGAEYFTATKTEFYNPQQSLEEKPKANCRSRRSNSEDNSEREDDFQYVQKINILGDTDEGFDQLTPIEAFIYYFCQDCLIQDDNHRITDRQRAQLCVKGEDDVRRGLLEQGLKLEDFSDICCTSVPRDLKETNLRPRMFSADKIRRANKKHGFTSVIDEKKLEDLLK